VNGWFLVNNPFIDIEVRDSIIIPWSTKAIDFSSILIESDSLDKELGSNKFRRVKKDIGEEIEWEAIIFSKYDTTLIRWINVTRILATISSNINWWLLSVILRDRIMYVSIIVIIIIID
jgi:hypothetical protein